MISKAEQAGERYVLDFCKLKSESEFKVMQTYDIEDAFLAGVHFAVEQAVQARELTTSGHGEGSWMVPLSVLESLLEEKGNGE